MAISGINDFELWMRARERQRQYDIERAVMIGSTISPEEYFMQQAYSGGSSPSSTTVSPTKQFDKLKKSVKQIEAEPFTGEVRKNIESKIGRLQKAGATTQALILESELTTRDALIRLKEWDYKLLTKKTIDEFQKGQNKIMRSSYDIALKLHIDPLDKYCGNPQNGEAKDRIIPDNILDELETAKERELFDEVKVLWAEKVKDPILLGCVHGCEDYFFIAEWGDDITFEQITKGE